MDKPIKLSHSYSSIKMYENCPYRYYRQRIVRDVIDEGSVATKLGEEIHKALELRLKERKELPFTLTGLEPTCKTIEAKDGQLLLEKELTLTKDLQPTTWFAKDAWLRSKLDVLHMLGDKATVLDWKTGKRRVDSFQLDLFAAQVFQHYPDIQVVNTALVWTKDKEIDTFTHRRESVAALWEDILSRISRIQRSADTDKWQVRPSGLCRWCPLYGKCPATKGEENG